MFRCSPILVGFSLVAFVLAASMVNHGLVNSNLPVGPGLTLDESFNIDQGVYLADAFAQHGPLLFTPGVARKVFGAPRYLPDHPPMGRFVLGVSHDLSSPFISGSEETLYNVPAARLGSCVAFGITVLLLSEFSRRKYGLTTGLLVSAMLTGMPHLMGHARLGALESCTNLAWVAAMIPLLTWWTRPTAPTTLQAAVGGVFWGLLLLTKVQGIFLPVLLFLWSVAQFRWKSIRPLTVFGIIGAVIFFAGWPWLWLDPVKNVMTYLGRTTDRQTLYCWYLGQRFADKDVPWHFPFVTTLISLPIWTLAGLILRSVRAALDSTEKLLLLFVLMPLTVFAVPGVPVYDGTRLFLIVMPPMSILAARGFSLWLDGRSQTHQAIPTTGGGCSRGSQVFVGILVGCVPLYWTMQPFAISQYGILAGGNQGADKLGMEAGYWSDALNSEFWNEVPENSLVYVAPVSHQFQLSDLESLVPIVQHRKIKLVPWEYDPVRQRGLLLLIHRLADLRSSLRAVPPGAIVIAESSRDGITMARLIDTTDAEFPELVQ
ncbi:MAG: glycosyltransferase family 39 protein [Planctomycetaceae bacterium]